jgi:hypothetical protein
MFRRQIVKSRALRQAWLGFVFSSLVNVAIVLVAISLGRLARTKGPALYAMTSRAIGPHLTQFIIGASVVFIGFAAHWFKGKSQRWYGRVEVLFGIASGFSIALNLSADHAWLPQGATLVGCAYVIARGLNNSSEAKAKLTTRAPGR